MWPVRKLKLAPQEGKRGQDGKLSVKLPPGLEARVSTGSRMAAKQREARMASVA
jgi:hypothetical protein